MITTAAPQDWRQLQEEAGRILHECGFSVDVEKKMQTARGTAEIDVYAEENIDGRRYTIICECKHWRANVPQTVVHSFRALAGDLGANLGLIISSSDFQTGAHEVAAFSNIKLVTWREFQNEFERTWLLRFLQNTVAERCAPLLTYAEPLLPNWFDKLSAFRKKKYLDLKRRHDPFGWLMMSFTPYVRIICASPFPRLPLAEATSKIIEDIRMIPNAILSATGYRQFLEAAIAHSDEVVEQFRRLRPKEIPLPDDE